MDIWTRIGAERAGVEHIPLFFKQRVTSDDKS